MSCCRFSSRHRRRLRARTAPHPLVVAPSPAGHLLAARSYARLVPYPRVDARPDSAARPDCAGGCAAPVVVARAPRPAAVPRPIASAPQTAPLLREAVLAHSADRPVPASDARADDFKLALYYQRSGEFDQALVHYKAVLQRDELDVEAHNNLGHLYMAKGLLDEAAREFQRVIAIDPGYTPAHVNLSAALTRLGRPDAAAAEARAALAIQPRNSDATVNLAIAQKAAGQTADAQATLIRALSLDRRSAVAHYNLAQLYEDSGELALAKEHYQAFLQYAGPDDASYAADVRIRLSAIASRIR